MKILSLILIFLFLNVSTNAQPAPKVLAFTHVNVIDMTGRPTQKNMTVVIIGQRIASISRTGRVQIPRAAIVINASDQFLIPGLWDMHVHFTETGRTFPMLIANGVLGVRNLGGNAEDIFRWREEVENGMLVGPRIVACGPIVDGPRIVASGPAVGVGTPADGREIVQKLKQQGAEFIKVYDQLPRDTYFAIIEEARKLKLPVVGHVPLPITTTEASDAGQKSIEHLGTILQESSSVSEELRNWKAAEVKDGDYSAIPRNIAARGTRMLDTYNPSKAQDVFQHLRRNQTWQVPTLVTKRSLALIDDIVQTEDECLKFIPPDLLTRWSPKENFLLRYRTPEYIAFNKRLFKKELELVGAMHRAGVPFLTGTDLSVPYVFAGFSVHEEMALFVAAGFTPLAALQAATRNPAVFLGELDSMGTVEPGKLANLVLLGADPLKDIRNSQKVEGVVLRGKYFPNLELEKMLQQAERVAKGEH